MIVSGQPYLQVEAVKWFLIDNDLVNGKWTQKNGWLSIKMLAKGICTLIKRGGQAQQGRPRQKFI